MSKRSNVNPGQDKVAGRDRLGEPLGQQKDNVALAKNRESKQPKRQASKKR